MIPEDYPTKYQDCRVYRHIWQRIGYFTIDGSAHPNVAGCIVQTTRCQRCDTEKDTVLSPRGTVRLTAWYTYPHDYLVVGEDKPTYANWREREVRQSKVYQDRKSMMAQRDTGRR